MVDLLQIHEPGETPLPHADDASVAIGIDLGTTNSVVAISTDGKTQVLRDDDGQALVPSVVAYDLDKERVHFTLGAEGEEGVPPQLRAILMRAMGPFPEERYATVEQMKHDLRTFSGTSAPAPRAGGIFSKPTTVAPLEALSTAPAEIDEDGFGRDDDSTRVSLLEIATYEMPELDAADIDDDLEDPGEATRVSAAPPELLRQSQPSVTTPPPRAPAPSVAPAARIASISAFVTEPGDNVSSRV